MGVWREQWAKLKSPVGNERRTRIIDKNRRAFLTILGQNPEASRAKLKDRNPSLYGWLKKKELEWFEAVLPKCKINRRPLVRWEEREAFLLERLAEYVLECERSIERPRRRCREGFLDALGTEASFDTAGLRKMPKLSREIDELRESTIAFAKRRLRWAIATYANSARLLSFDEFRRLTGTSLVWTGPFVADVRRAYETLKPFESTEDHQKATVL